MSGCCCGFEGGLRYFRDPDPLRTHGWYNDGELYLWKDWYSVSGAVSISPPRGLSVCENENLVCGVARTNATTSNSLFCVLWSMEGDVVNRVTVSQVKAVLDSTSTPITTAHSLQPTGVRTNGEMFFVYFNTVTSGGSYVASYICRLTAEGEPDLCKQVGRTLGSAGGRAEFYIRNDFIYIVQNSGIGLIPWGVNYHTPTIVIYDIGMNLIADTTHLTTLGGATHFHVSESGQYILVAGYTPMGSALGTFPYWQIFTWDGSIIEYLPTWYPVNIPPSTVGSPDTNGEYAGPDHDYAWAGALTISQFQFNGFGQQITPHSGLGVGAIILSCSISDDLFVYIHDGRPNPITTVGYIGTQHVLIAGPTDEENNESGFAAHGWKVYGGNIFGPGGVQGNPTYYYGHLVLNDVPNVELTSHMELFGDTLYFTCRNDGKQIQLYDIADPDSGPVLLDTWSWANNDENGLGTGLAVDVWPEGIVPLVAADRVRYNA